MLAKILMIIILGFISVAPAAGEEKQEHIGARFKGEILQYEIGFWFFSTAGKGTVFFQDLGLEKYRVFHGGQACGFVGWITGQRREIYQSLLTTINGGRRLLPLRFDEEIFSFGQSKSKRIYYNYDQRKVIIEREKAGQKIIQEKEIPQGFLYDDPVSAFYNFRHGVYGPVEQGKKFILRTIPEKGEEVIIIQVATAGETELKKAAEKDKHGKEFLTHIILNREMWGKKKVEIEIWFDKKLTPVSGMVKDLPFLGNIYGRCTYRGFSSSPSSFSRWKVFGRRKEID